MDEIRRVKEGGGGTRYTDQPKHASQTWRLGDRHDKALLHALPLSLYRRPFPSLTLDPQPLLTSSTPSPLRRGASQAAISFKPLYPIASHHDWIVRVPSLSLFPNYNSFHLLAISPPVVRRFIQWVSAVRWLGFIRGVVSDVIA